MPIERAMNSVERSRWIEFLTEWKNCTIEKMIASVQFQQYQIAKMFGLENSIVLKTEPDHGLLFDAYDRMVKWLEWLDDQTLGLNFKTRIDGKTDFDICAQPGTNSDMVASYKNPKIGFEGLPLIIAGVVIVGSIIAYVVLMRSELSQLRNEYNSLLNDANNKYCAVPGSALCLAWQKRKAESGYNQKTTTIEGLKKKVIEVVETISKGLGKGLIVAVPLLLLFFAVKGQKR